MGTTPEGLLLPKKYRWTLGAGGTAPSAPAARDAVHVNTGTVTVGFARELQQTLLVRS